MFAVPGWSVSAASLKSETAKDGKGPAGEKGDKKRKRESGPTNVTSGNVAQLYESVIEGKPGKKAKLDAKNKKERKKQKKQQETQNQSDAPAKDVSDEKASPAKGHAAPGLASGEKSEKRNKKKSKGETPSKEAKQSVPDSKAVIPAAAAAAPVPAPSKLTPLQAAMREKLVSARFRHLNETLYTRPSKEAFGLFEDSPEMFQEYHEGFRRQVNVWPENPVDGYIEDIRVRARQRHAPKGGSGAAPLLRTNGTCTIADLGCGDAKLAATLQQDKKKLKLEILSYDLQSPSPHVTRADIANLPLEDGSVNVVIFCLALMGTNWLDFIEEAYRVLHWKGELWVAEIKSRFAPVGKGKKGPVTHSVGNRKKVPGKKGKNPEDDAAREAELAVEVDGADDRRQETDVSAFVEALRKRGFVLQGEGQAAVDLSNRMFVKMHFTKGAPAVVGKGVEAAKDAGRPVPKRGAVKFIDAADQGTADEGSILKPCVYKIR
ncbi:uncharacterized protein JN550_000899 [Neoarthrinium moseri]|uniref:uncharacterized protein n=1 Tax=Neoarthrinium moseri TaxID=1658444 RepID=UPI001FDC5F99|nr:uncharacterized protein JN550_000899 [Neoarthrinium moseri]KAI1876827.1 hypothetical protein JN550_000899 [Neoarthrinium moseri]